jgi:hypothetical protein
MFGELFREITIDIEQQKINYETVANFNLSTEVSSRMLHPFFSASLANGMSFLSDMKLSYFVGKKNFFTGTKGSELSIEEGYVIGQLRVLKQRSNGSCGYYCLFNSILLVAGLFSSSDENCVGMLAEFIS